MILLCSGQVSPKHFDALLLLACQLEKRGHRVAIDQRFVPDEITWQNKYELAPYTADITGLAPSVIVVVGADSISGDVQVLLSAIRLDDTATVWGLGHFADLQDEITARNKIAYATGREPRVYDLTLNQRQVMPYATVTPLLTEICDSPIQNTKAEPRVLVYLQFDDDDEDHETSLSHLSGLHYSPALRFHLLTNSKGKAIIAKSRFSDFSVFSYGELPPTDLLNYADVLVFTGPNVPGERMASLAIIAMGAGKVVVDCTQSSSFAASGAPVLRGPIDPTALSGYLHQTVLKNRYEIGDRTQKSNWLTPFDISNFEKHLCLPSVQKPSDEAPPKTVFFPTNGNGLGHAQRCALIAENMKPDSKLLFAAFPSCVGMLRNRNFGCAPLVPRSSEHADEFAADLINYLRLRSVVRLGDQIVFDGGYVFDSVYRLVSGLNIPSIWIRRGLWRSEQVNPRALERERAFSKVICPDEVFPELNSVYSTGNHIHCVGPIVQDKKLTKAEALSLRDRLSIEFDTTIDTLAVTMLGGGIASERTAQIQMLCSTMERRKNCVHLVLVWPHAVVDNALYGWNNSYVVRTTHAIELCQAADLCVSAAGYNSFHELLYARVPAIFIPQEAPYLDNQERRAIAAAERGLSVFVKEDELFKLEREAVAFIDDGKGQKLHCALREQSLPEPGNRAAARIIEKGLNR